MVEYQDYMLQLHFHCDYYGLIGLTLHASDLLIRRQLSIISRSIFPGYRCGDTFYCKQWTDFTKIRQTLMNRDNRKRYNYYRKYSEKLDINIIKPKDIWKPFSKPNVCSINILALIFNSNDFIS